MSQPTTTAATAAARKKPTSTAPEAPPTAATVSTATRLDKSNSTTAPVAGFSSPVYRGPLDHGTAAELQEGFRILSKNQRVASISAKELHAVMQSTGLHISEEELQELLRVVHQDEHTLELDFAEFMLLMTNEVDDTMVEEMKSAFRVADKDNTGMVSRKQFTEMFVSLGEHSNGDELEELMSIGENADHPEMVDYNKFVAELAVRLNTM